MLLHSMQISSGTTPMRINPANMMQPKQIARNASNEAATSNIAMTICAAPSEPVAHKTEAVVEKTTPTPCAKRFGGPATNLWLIFKAGVTTCVAIRPSGLNFGPANTRAQKPNVRGTNTQPLCVTRKRTLISTTPVATVRADVSLTGLGNEKKRSRGVDGVGVSAIRQGYRLIR